MKKLLNQTLIVSAQKVFYGFGFGLGMSIAFKATNEKKEPFKKNN